MKYDNYVRLEVLTPVHIGSGDTSDPLDYVITTKNGVDYFCQIDLDGWLEDYPDQDGLTKVLDGGDLSKIRKYIADHLDSDIYARTTSRIISAEIGKKYRQHINNLKSPNQLLIDPALKNPLTGGLLIPGSSIKGAMRTAVIDFLDRNSTRKLKSGDYNEGIKALLGDIGNNAFKQLKIGDFEMYMDSGQIMSAKSKPKNPNNTKKPPHNDCEVCTSKALLDTNHQSFGRFAIGNQAERNHDKLEVQLNSWDLPQFMKIVNDFYRKRYIEERNKFYHQLHFSKSQNVIKLLDRELLSLEDNQMILRVGHYSHIECMTVTHNSPKCQIIKGNKVYGVLRTLADGIYPFGWVKLTLCDKEEYDEYWQKKGQQDQKIARQRQQLRQTKIVRRQQQLEEQIKLQQQKEQVEQERKAQLEDEQKNPWKKVVRQLDKINNWGDLKQQILEKEELAEFRNVAEFVQGVLEQAIIVRGNTKKWDADRDAILALWFEPTDLQWQGDNQENSATETDPAVDQINDLADWGAFSNSGIIMDSLSLLALQALKLRLQEWKCDNKRAKKPKQEGWKQIQQLIKSKS
ncbi:MAG: type III-A CRISPR-associated RAMP protein Csm5 [Desulfuromusa sp.]|nr:type III-A CRISPR-associated RAMP protein Csm5 [Desulfuromusa sp.]